jgi:hypothetical protein
MEGVWIAPVTAQVMMTLDMAASSVLARSCPARAAAGRAGIPARGGVGWSVSG